MHITGENTVNSYACVNLMVFYVYFCWKHGKKLCVCTFSGFLGILLVKTRLKIMHGYI